MSSTNSADPAGQQAPDSFGLAASRTTSANADMGGHGSFKAVEPPNSVAAYLATLGVQVLPSRGGCVSTDLVDRLEEDAD